MTTTAPLETYFPCYRIGDWRDYKPRLPLEVRGIQGDVMPHRTNGVLVGVIRINDGVQLLVHASNILANNTENFAKDQPTAAKPRLTKLPSIPKQLEQKMLAESLALLD